jgi:hypothetical protein
MTENLDVLFLERCEANEVPNRVNDEGACTEDVAEPKEQLVKLAVDSFLFVCCPLADLKLIRSRGVTREVVPVMIQLLNLAL